ncbi:MAG: alpha/beta hydrolase [Alphaproteobacteria bacterium]|nr:alpha/beta hydrolase [Alphaproteobacteria bacterium]
MPNDVTNIHTSEPPSASLARLVADARRVETPSGEGHMVWHVWGTGEPVVLLHGSFGSWTHWVRNIPILAQRWMVVAADLPGMGDSHTPPLPFDATSLAAIVAAGIEAILPAPMGFHLAGFSFGGIVGGPTASRLGARVRSFTLVGSNALGLPMAKRPALAKPNRAMTAAEVLDIHRQNLAIVMFGDERRIDPLALHIQVENTGRARIRSGAIPGGDTLKLALDQLRVPIFGIWGGKDSTAGPHLEARRQLFESLSPPAKFQVIAGAGHWVAYEAAETFNAMFMDILAAH